MKSIFTPHSRESGIKITWMSARLGVISATRDSLMLFRSVALDLPLHQTYMKQFQTSLLKLKLIVSIQEILFLLTNKVLGCLMKTAASYSIKKILSKSFFFV